MLLIIDCGSPKTPAIKAVLDSFGISYSAVKMASLAPHHTTGTKGIIITGSPMLLTESYPVLFGQKFSFLRYVDVPVLGICFGLQVMGLAFGETVFKGKEVRKEEAIEVFFDDPLFRGIPPHPAFVEDHTEGVGLPDDDFFLLASSADYEVEAMKHKKKNMYGVQFHPEVSGENGRKLLRNFCDMCT